MQTERIWNGTVVRERNGGERPMKGVVISQTQNPDCVIVRYEGMGEWQELVWNLIVLDEQPVQDGTRAYSNG